MQAKPKIKPARPAAVYARSKGSNNGVGGAGGGRGEGEGTREEGGWGDAGGRGRDPKGGGGGGRGEAAGRLRGGSRLAPVCERCGLTTAPVRAMAHLQVRLHVLLLPLPCRTPTNPLPLLQLWSQYHPCECQGGCKADCPCAGDANFCEASGRPAVDERHIGGLHAARRLPDRRISPAFLPAPGRPRHLPSATPCGAEVLRLRPRKVRQPLPWLQVHLGELVLVRPTQPRAQPLRFPFGALYMRPTTGHLSTKIPQAAPTGAGFVLAFVRRRVMRWKGNNRSRCRICSSPSLFLSCQVGRRCNLNMCPCLAAGRECDPDLCKVGTPAMLDPRVLASCTCDCVDAWESSFAALQPRKCAAARASHQHTPPFPPPQLCVPTLTGTHQEGWQCSNFRMRWVLRRSMITGPGCVQASHPACCTAVLVAWGEVQAAPQMDASLPYSWSLDTSGPSSLPCRSLGQKKRVLMGLSDIQGWGAFLQQAALKDDFVVGGGGGGGGLIEEHRRSRPTCQSSHSPPPPLHARHAERNTAVQEQDGVALSSLL